MVRERSARKLFLLSGLEEEMLGSCFLLSGLEEEMLGSCFY